MLKRIVMSIMACVVFTTQAQEKLYVGAGGLLANGRDVAVSAPSGVVAEGAVLGFVNWANVFSPSQSQTLQLKSQGNVLPALQQELTQNQPVYVPFKTQANTVTSLRIVNSTVSRSVELQFTETTNMPADLENPIPFQYYIVPLPGETNPEVAVAITVPSGVSLVGKTAFFEPIGATSVTQVADALVSVSGQTLSIAATEITGTIFIADTPVVSTPVVDTDGDGVVDATEITDGTDANDSCDFVLANQTETPSTAWMNLDCDADGVTNAAELTAGTNPLVAEVNTDDTDGDGVPDTEDEFPLDDTEDTDTDGDGTGDNADTDDDNDGVADTADDFPLDGTEDTDTDGDGTGDNADTDDDNDGVADTDDDFPLDSTEDIDTDGDGTGDNADTDDDNDGVADTADDFPLDGAEDTDTDGDGTGDNADTDDDNDGVADTADDFPLDGAEDKDTDGDGTGDNADTDDDNDGVADTRDAYPLDPGRTVETPVASDALTPNGDGVNDTWQIQDIEAFTGSVVRVYNRWGEEVFSAKNYQNDWNGYYKDQSMSLPSGSYYYQIELEGDGVITHQGWLYITK